VDAIGRLELAISCGWLVTVCWLLFHAFDQSKRFRHVSSAAREPNGHAEKVVIVIPARNESFNIRRCVESLLGQRYPRALLRVIVVDDHSRFDRSPSGSLRSHCW
jgi:cellulose synthase/poly-beta-1,6-N-acetylglucosamine synthase-like glycosyltransferase